MGGMVMLFALLPLPYMITGAPFGLVGAAIETGVPPGRVTPGDPGNSVCPAMTTEEAPGAIVTGELPIVAMTGAGGAPPFTTGTGVGVSLKVCAGAGGGAFAPVA